MSNGAYVGKMHPVHVLHDSMLCHGVARRGGWMVVAAIDVVQPYSMTSIIFR